MKINLLSSTAVKNLPNIITLANLALGFWSINLIIQGRYLLAIGLLIAAMVLDYLDGRTASWLDAVTSLGKHLDSLSDLVSFGVVPALMCGIILPLNAYWAEAAAVFYLCCSAYRLARFNSSEQGDGFFKGFPVTAAGPLLAILCWYQYTLPVFLPAGAAVVLGVSMVSGITFYGFKGRKFCGFRRWLIFAVGLLIMVSFWYPWILGMVLTAYYSSGVLVFVLKKILP